MISSNDGNGFNEISLEHRSLVTQMVDYLRSAILNGHIALGEELSEVQLAEDLEVSRATVREALRALGSAGLLEKKPRKSWRVREIDGRTVWEVAVVRANVEGLAAYLVTQNITPEAKEALSAIVDDMKSAVRDESHDRFNQADLEFHHTLLELSGNEILKECWLPLHTYSVLILGKRNFMYPSLQEILDHHTPILNAILSEDPELAQAIIKRDIFETYRPFAQKPEAFLAPWGNREQLAVDL